MHELSLIRNLLNKLEMIAIENDAKIVSIKIRLGALAHISSEHFREHFVAMAKDKLKNAKLEIYIAKDIDANAQDIMLESVALAED